MASAWVFGDTEEGREWWQMRLDSEGSECPEVGLFSQETPCHKFTHLPWTAHTINVVNSGWGLIGSRGGLRLTRVPVLPKGRTQGCWSVTCDSKERAYAGVFKEGGGLVSPQGLSLPQLQHLFLGFTIRLVVPPFP